MRSVPERVTQRGERWTTTARCRSSVLNGAPGRPRAYRPEGLVYQPITGASHYGSSSTPPNSLRLVGQRRGRLHL